METKEAPGKEGMGAKRKNLTFLKHRLYMLERRKTDTVVENSVSGDQGNSGTLRRSQSDRTEYSQKLQGNGEKMTYLLFVLQPYHKPGPHCARHPRNREQARSPSLKKLKMTIPTPTNPLW